MRPALHSTYPAPPAMNQPAEPLVRFTGVQKTYDGEQLVVRALDLDIQRGEFLSLLGPSGSCKTTTLMMLAGFEPATHGEIYLEGVPINNVPPHKRGIGMVFQNYALFPHMTVAENLAFPLEVRKIPKADREAKVQRALEMVRLPEFGHRRPAQLSGGQQQRVAVARALVFEPELILMDEPLGALDKNLREEMQYEIKHIHENLGVTVVYVTHDQSEALTMSNRIAVFDDGIIQQLSTPDALYEKPESSFVAQFIGENNRLQGTVKTVNGAICTVQLDSGETVQAAKIKVEDGGSRTTLSIRPERVALNPGPGEVPVILPAKIEELIYLGDHIRARMSVANTDEFIVKVPNDTGRQDLVVGRETTVGWQSEDCRALDEDLARVKVTSKS